MSEEAREVHFDGRGGRLGVDRILWELRGQHDIDPYLAEENPYWDGCTTWWTFAVSRNDAIARGWEQHFGANAPDYIVRPREIVSCLPLRFENERERALQENRHDRHD